MDTKKNGKRNRKQRYKCVACHHRWGGKKSPQNWVQKAYEKYTIERQTLHNLSETYGKSSKTIRRHFDRHYAVTGEISVTQKPVNLVLDATFFHRREGVLVARGNGSNLLWHEIETESIAVYDSLLDDLIAAGFQFRSCTIDGRRGVLRLLERKLPNLPIQLCQFHQVQIVTRYLSKRPKLFAGIELRNLTLTLSKTDRKTFTVKLQEWHRKWEIFLKEKTINPYSKRWFYTHRRIRSAYRSLNTHLPWLFTYQDFPELNIPNTTNSCDGSFAHWKNKLKIHRGLSQSRKRKMLHFFLENT